MPFSENLKRRRHGTGPASIGGIAAQSHQLREGRARSGPAQRLRKGRSERPGRRRRPARGSPGSRWNRGRRHIQRQWRRRLGCSCLELTTGPAAAFGRKRAFSAGQTRNTAGPVTATLGKCDSGEPRHRHPAQQAWGSTFSDGTTQTPRDLPKAPLRRGSRLRSSTLQLHL